MMAAAEAAAAAPAAAAAAPAAASMMLSIDRLHSSSHQVRLISSLNFAKSYQLNYVQLSGFKYI